MKNILTYLLLATTTFSIGQTTNPTDTLAYYKSRLTNKDSAYYYNYKLGRLLLDKSPDKAISFFNTSIKGNEKFADSYYYRAIATYRYNDYPTKQVKKDISKAISLDSSKALYYLTRADFLDEEDNTFKIQDYKKAIQLDPKNYIPYVRLCETFAPPFISFLHRNEIDTVENYYKKAIDVSGGNIQVYLSRGKLRMSSLRNINGGFEDFNHVIKMAPDKKDAYYERGCAFYLTREYDKACADFKKYKELGGGQWIYYIQESCDIDYKTWDKK